MTNDTWRVDVAEAATNQHMIVHCVRRSVVLDVPTKKFLSATGEAFPSHMYLLGI